MLTEQPVEGDPPKPESLPRDQQERRERIVETALHLLEHGDYEDIQIRDVAEGAEVAIGTIYRYFSSKEHLFAAVLWEWTNSLQTDVGRHPLDGHSPGAQLKALLARVLSAFERWPQFLRMVTVVESTPDPHARSLFGDFVEHNNRTFLRPLEDLASPDDAEAVVEVVQSVLGNVLRNWAVGLLTMDDVRARLNRAVDLIFSSPPKVKRQVRS